MQIGMCCVPVSPMRAEPSHRSEMVSQLLFGEMCSIIDETEDWIRIKNNYDAYEGWIQTMHLYPLNKPAEQHILAADIVNTVLWKHEPMHVPLGSCIADMAEIEFHGRTLNTHQAVISKEALPEICFKYLNTTYLWGGRSVFGIDCSGFVQMVFRFFNVRLLRDASLQITQGNPVTLHDIKTGDLAFFNNENGKITHVGMMLDKNRIIHASGKVRVDMITPEGIIHSETKKLTHHFHSVRRYF